MRDPRGLVPGEEAPDPAHPAFPRLRDAPERAPSQAAEKRRGVRGGDRGWRLTREGGREFGGGGEMAPFHALVAAAIIRLDRFVDTHRTRH